MAEVDNQGIIYQDYTGKFHFKSLKAMRSYNKTIMEAMGYMHTHTGWPGAYFHESEGMLP